MRGEVNTMVPTTLFQLNSIFIFVLDLVRMLIKSAIVSGFGSSIVRVTLERADGESSLASLLASIVDGESITVMGETGRAVAMDVLVMMEPS